VHSSIKKKQEKRIFGAVHCAPQKRGRFWHVDNAKEQMEQYMNKSEKSINCTAAEGQLRPCY
jgi:hypothetical protein